MICALTEFPTYWIFKIRVLYEGLKSGFFVLQAWYRRGKANAALGNYKDAIHDLDVAKNLELSLGGKKQIENELKIIVDQYEGTRSVQHIENTVGNFSKIFNLSPSKCSFSEFYFFNIPFTIKILIFLVCALSSIDFTCLAI